MYNVHFMLKKKKYKFFFINKSIYNIQQKYEMQRLFLLNQQPLCATKYDIVPRICGAVLIFLSIPILNVF